MGSLHRLALTYFGGPADEADKRCLSTLDSSSVDSKLQWLDISHATLDITSEDSAIFSHNLVCCFIMQS